MRRGWTTGACAAAAATAAAQALLTGRFPPRITIELPRGARPAFALSQTHLEETMARAGVIKDAGDDPDVTHGAEIIAEIRRAEPGAGIGFEAGEGVGAVTLPGLPLAVGEPAINPAPRKIITANLTRIVERLGGGADFTVRISIPGGEEMAAKTMNGRLGILGGLSVLGTTGIVIPYSCASWIHSIHRGIDVARANGVTHIAAATGSTSEAAVRAHYQLPETALIDMGDFAGGMLKYLRGRPVPKLTIAGGFAKLTKLAQGRMDLHSSRSSVDFARLSETLRSAGADEPQTAAARRANTAMEVLKIASDAGLPLADRIAAGAREAALATLSGGTEVEVIIYDRQGVRVGYAG